MFELRSIIRRIRIRYSMNGVTGLEDRTRGAGVGRTTGADSRRQQSAPGELESVRPPAPTGPGSWSRSDRRQDPESF
ncbi:hypothetical protein VZT92_007966 [Zoarces viviparus]|uniref:Uncharacterized protein n=1 Tax=Zoarces viviparus TaxID=48416 RepID=A0AAW1FLP8_ZOAVI